MSVFHAKKPRRCDSCGKVIHTGQLVTDLSGIAHVDCGHPNANRLGRSSSVAAPAPEGTLVGPGVVRVDGHVAEGEVVDRGDGTYDFRGQMVCGPHSADGEHLVAANPKEER